jgi:hypothetical protein
VRATLTRKNRLQGARVFAGGSAGKFRLARPQEPRIGGTERDQAKLFDRTEGPLAPKGCVRDRHPQGQDALGRLGERSE